MTPAGTRSRTQSSARKRTHSRSNPSSRSRKRQRISWKVRLYLLGFAIIAGILSWGAVARYTAPVSNTSQTRFDAIILLGSPADGDGNPTPLQLAKVNEAVREYERGVAPRLIISGGATHANFVEADVMARTARAEGVPASAIVEERQATDTIQNACYTARIMKSNGWHSAEVISRATHLPRAALIFGGMPIEWRVHAAPLLTPHDGLEIFSATMETFKTVRYLVWARRMEQCEL